MEFTIDEIFDDFLLQRTKLSYEEIESGKKRIERFVQIKEWKSKYGYKFQAYSNDHLIDGKKHFHFDNINAKY